MDRGNPNWFQRNDPVYNNFEGVYEFEFNIIIYETKLEYLCYEAGGQIVGN